MFVVILLFLMLTALLNIALGCFAATRLGWGPPDLSSYWLSLLGVPVVEAAAPPPVNFANDVDPRLLIDKANQVSRRLKNLKCELTKPNQIAIQQLMTTLQKVTFELEFVQQRVVALKTSTDNSSWKSILDECSASLQELLGELPTKIDAMIEHLPPEFSGEIQVYSDAIRDCLKLFNQEVANVQLVDAGGVVRPGVFFECFNRANREFLTQTSSLTGAILAGVHADEFEDKLLVDEVTEQKNIFALELERQKVLAAKKIGTRYFAALLRADVDEETRRGYGLLATRYFRDAVYEQVKNNSNGFTLVGDIGNNELLVWGKVATIDDFARPVEQIRQTIEKATFQVGETKITLTFSVVIDEDLLDSATGTLIEKLRDYLKQANSYGANRTFLCDEGTPTPVIPLDLKLEPITLNL